MSNPGEMTWSQLGMCFYISSKVNCHGKASQEKLKNKNTLALRKRKKKYQWMSYAKANQMSSSST
jgi:hypothetical protein